MKTLKEEKSVSLKLLRELYESALLYQREELDRQDTYMRQYLGSNEIDGSAERATTVRNITFEIIESEINTSVPYPKVDPLSYSERHEKSAKIIEKLCQNTRSLSGLEALNDADEHYTYIYGGSVFYIDWDSCSHTGIKIHCMPPKNFLPEPGVSDIGDMEYCFLRFETTKGELIRKWGADVAAISSADCLAESEKGSSLADTVNLVIAFYRDDDGEVGRAVFSGNLLLSNIPRYYRRRGKICKKCGAPERRCECNAGFCQGEIIYEQREIEGGKRIRLPYYTPKDFPIVLRKSTLNESSVFGISDCALIRPMQQGINKIESRILSKLLRSAVTPVMPEDANISVTNAVFGQVIRLRPGESAESYGKIDTTPDISADIEEADRLYDQAKRVIGISDALQGLDNVKTESGYARQLKISQAASRLESKIRLKKAAYSEIYRLIFLHYLAFSDEVRPLCFKDSLGRLHISEFSRTDFIEYSPEKGYYYCDEYIFSTDNSDESGYARDVLWERNLANLESGTLGDRSSPETLLCYWQLQERAHYPYASVGVAYFKELIEKRKENEKNNE